MDVLGGCSARVLLAAGACAAPVLLTGCGGGRVSLATLAQRQQAFVGKEVSAQGRVERERDPSGASYYVLSDGKGDLVGLKPAVRASHYRGDHASVRGRFEVQNGFGRVIIIRSIRSQGS